VGVVVFRIEPGGAGRVALFNLAQDRFLAPPGRQRVSQSQNAVAREI